MLTRTTLELLQFECLTCGRLFYINRLDKNSVNASFGCPFGCDDDGKFKRVICTQVQKLIEADGSEIK